MKKTIKWYQFRNIMLLSRDSIRLSHNLSSDLFASGQIPNQLMLLVDNGLKPWAETQQSNEAFEEIVLNAESFGNLPVGRQITGIIYAALGIGITVALFQLQLVEELKDLYLAAGGIMMMLMGLWMAGLLPQFWRSIIAKPCRIEFGTSGPVFESGRDIAVVGQGSKNMGRELVLISHAGQIRSLWLSDAQVEKIAQLWSAAGGMATPSSARP